MNSKESFDFVNSELWLKYTHKNYRTLDEISYRYQNDSTKFGSWEQLKKEFIIHRKTAAIPLFLNSIDKKFWFYPADCVMQKANELEKRGNDLYQKILKNSSFKEELLLDSTVEEAITSAIYEGANSTRAKAQELIESKKQPKNKDEWMLYNNYIAMEWIKTNKSKSVSCELIRDVHEIVTKNTLSDEDLDFSGKFRNDRVFVFSSQGERKHEGVEHEKIETSLAEAINVVTKHQRYINPIIEGILLHYFIAYIHPFFDGNGRTARTIFYFSAMKKELKFIELLSVSAYLKLHGRQYEKSYEKVVGNELDITYFIDFNLDALLKAIAIVESKVSYLISIINLRETLRLSENQVGLLQRLALNKFKRISIEEYADRIQKSREIARQELKQLHGLNLIKEFKDGKKFVYQVDRQELAKHVGAIEVSPL